jgi:preprotein translocase subunit SecG
LETFVYTLHFLVCFVLIGVVLLQRGKGADLGASLGGGSANTIFGSRGAGNFLTRITTASAIIFMGTSLSLAYFGYRSSDVELFDTSEPFELPSDGGLVPVEDEAGGLVEIPAASEGGLVEIPAAGEQEPAAAPTGSGAP